MAEASTLSPSDNSSLSHKRHITDVAPSLDHQYGGSSPKPTITLSPPPLEVKSSTLEAGVTEAQETQFSPEQSPKKAKLFRSQNRSLTDEGCLSDEFLQVSENLVILDGKGELPDGVSVMESKKLSEIVHLGDEVGSTFSSEQLNLDDEKKPSQFELERKNEVFEQKEAVDELLEIKDAAGAMELENSSEFLELGATCEDCEENQYEADSKIAEMESEERAVNLDRLLQKLPESKDLTSSLTIEVMDETAVLDVSKNERKRSRRGKKGNSRNTSFVAGASNKGRGKSLYSRKEMEVLRFVNVKSQRKFWREIYDGFSATVKKEYDELGSFRYHTHGGSTSDYHQAGGKRNYNNEGILGTCSTVPNYNYHGILGESCSGNVNSDAEFISSSNYNCDGDNGGENGDDLAEEWSEDEESDDEYESIQRPAFKVEGEPDFESGPPEDGLEYLRRVRWEAKHVPKVKVAKLNNIKLKDQSVYMPKIPGIEECPSHLVPLRQWEDEFIADFSELRLALSCLEDASDNGPTDNSKSVIFARPEHKAKGHASENIASLKLTSGPPTLSTVQAMDPVSRVTMLRRRISLFENCSDLLKDDCVWLFALCAVVETPLDADTCASLRCLLRRCAQLRAAKTEVDDEVIMLNVLATISGRFFGQSEL